MKKLIAIAVVLALVAGVAFAQTANGITVNAWGRGAFSPLKFVGPEQANGEAKDKDDKGETYTGVGASWGGDKARIDFRINGATDSVGFNVNATAENNTLAGNDDAAKIWVKPFSNDILKLSVGLFVDDSIRGKIGNLDGGFSNFVLNRTPEEDAIFSRFTSNAGQGGADHGYMISSAPVDGLFIGLAVNGALDPWWNSGVAGGTPTGKAFQYMQLGAGYNIANIGHIRAQYIGGWSGTIDLTDKDQAKYYEAGKLARIEAAFALTAVEGLLVDLGTKIHLPLEIKNVSKVSNGLDLSLGATFNSGALGLGARVDISGLGAYTRGASTDDKSEGSATTVIRVVPTFALDAATLGLDVAFALGGKTKGFDGKEVDKSDWSQIGFGAFVSKGLASGSIKAGLTYTLPANNGDGKAYGYGVFQIPIILEYAFF